MGGSVYIRYPNEGDILINESIIINWDISNVRETGEEVFFKTEDMTLSMKKKDFKRCFHNKKNKKNQ
jgi:hypothetical protein